MATIDQERALREFNEQRGNFVEHLDLRLEEVGHGTARMRLPYRSEIANGTGAVHGGAIVSLCDTCFYIALASIYGREQETTTAQLACNFLASAKPPHDLIADAKVLKAGKRIVYGEVSVHSGDRLVAHATLNFLNTEHRP
ncbi:MAG: PaaI family thioesterase [Candidatus Eremiobacteraeota bacterium]|nr:PaaI family thioesterase [Candidatus Eremiobacteraeota bacterium]MBV8354791.1 PaaI family thioesterase [Candidatus Eremiobacteraeota bacterium]